MRKYLGFLRLSVFGEIAAVVELLLTARLQVSLLYPCLALLWSFTSARCFALQEHPGSEHLMGPFRRTLFSEREILHLLNIYDIYVK